MGKDIEEGGFRLAKEALINGEKQVVKVHTAVSMDTLKKMDLTSYRHARLSVQTQQQASYICSKFMERLDLADVVVPGRLGYVPSKLGLMIGGPLKDEYLMIEPHLSGKTSCIHYECFPKMGGSLLQAR